MTITKRNAEKRRKIGNSASEVARFNWQSSWGLKISNDIKHIRKGIYFSYSHVRFDGSKAQLFDFR